MEKKHKIYRIPMPIEPAKQLELWKMVSPQNTEKNFLPSSGKFLYIRARGSRTIITHFLLNNPLKKIYLSCKKYFYKLIFILSKI